MLALYYQRFLTQLWVCFHYLSYFEDTIQLKDEFGHQFSECDSRLQCRFSALAGSTNIDTQLYGQEGYECRGRI